MFLRNILIFSFSVFFCINSSYAKSKIDVVVGGYIFPPFVQEKNGLWFGLSKELVKLFNKSQKKFNFKFKKTSSIRRYNDLDNKDYDIILFENINWGWDKSKVDASIDYLSGGEVFITQKDGKKNQSYFDDLTGKKILGYLGYHYGFANFNADPKFLLEKYNARMTSSHEGNILSVSLGRTDLAIVTKSMLDIFLMKNPTLKNKILVSKKLDQVYRHTILVSKNSLATVTQMNELIKKLQQSGELEKVWKKFGIKERVEQ